MISVKGGIDGGGRIPVRYNIESEPSNKLFMILCAQIEAEILLIMGDRPPWYPTEVRPATAKEEEEEEQ